MRTDLPAGSAARLGYRRPGRRRPPSQDVLVRRRRRHRRKKSLISFLRYVGWEASRWAGGQRWLKFARRLRRSFMPSPAEAPRRRALGVNPHAPTAGPRSRLMPTAPAARLLLRRHPADLAVYQQMLPGGGQARPGCEKQRRRTATDWNRVGFNGSRTPSCRPCRWADGGPSEMSARKFGLRSAVSTFVLRRTPCDLCRHAGRKPTRLPRATGWTPYAAALLCWKAGWPNTGLTAAPARRRLPALPAGASRLGSASAIHRVEATAGLPAELLPRMASTAALKRDAASSGRAGLLSASIPAAGREARGLAAPSWHLSSLRLAERPCRSRSPVGAAVRDRRRHLLTVDDVQ